MAKLGYVLINSSINVTGQSFGNPYAQRLYELHKKNFMDMLNLIYTDRLAMKSKIS